MPLGYFQIHAGIKEGGKEILKYGFDDSASPTDSLSNSRPIDFTQLIQVSLPQLNLLNLELLKWLFA